MASEYEGVMAPGASVGRALENTSALSINHPLYQFLSQTMERKVAELSSARGGMRASATLCVVQVALGTEDMAVLTAMFPELRLVAYGHNKPAHALYTQTRCCSVEWLLVQARKYADSVLVLGSPLVAALESGLQKVLMLTEAGNAVAVHERHTAGLDAYRLYANHVAVSRDLGRPLSRAAYDSHLLGKGVVARSTMVGAGTAEAVCVDGGLYSYSPAQVAAMMLMVDAKVAFGFFVYHPSMLLNESGEIPGTGIWFDRADGDLHLKYPEGVAGVNFYDGNAWRAWLVSHTFTVGRRRQQWFQVELLKNRGPFMFYRVVRSPVRPAVRPIVHALELPQEQPMYWFSSWRMVKLGMSPYDARSWERTHYSVGRRLVERVYQFAMQLPREQFTQYAVRKQIEVVNDRVTVEGTTVKKVSPLGQRTLDALAVDLFCKAFVDRYESGNLTVQASEFVGRLSGFSSMNFSARVWALLGASAVDAWDATLGSANRYVRAAADAVRRFCSSDPQLTATDIQVMPHYVQIKDFSRAVNLDGGDVVAMELGRRAALKATGFGAAFARGIAELEGPFFPLDSMAFRVESFALFDGQQAQGREVDDVVGMMRALNPVQESEVVREQVDLQHVRRASDGEARVSFMPCADPVYVLNEFYSEVLPGVAESNLEYDTASVSLDPQDRVLAAPYLRLPRYFGDVPKPRLLYHSRLRALNVPKRQQTLQELLSAVAARNLNAPQVSMPQDDAVLAVEVWENFLDVACVPDARAKLEKFREETVELDEEQFREWVSQSTPEKLAAVRRELEEQSKALAEMPVEDYLVMLKADVKPTLSKKPLDTRTEPQVIVYHEKALSAFYSSIFRVLVRRFLSLLKPNYHVNLLKDTKDIRNFVAGVHPFGARDLKYLENDFSKFDKSQGRFVFCLEQYVFEQLGMNRELLDKWAQGHVECRLRSVALGLSLHVMYQRKSGDATTSFGNVLLNVLSVSYAYRGTVVVWALFMGDDSLVCAKAIAHGHEAVMVLAEVFNLGAKTYITDEPYFASHFVVVDDVNRSVYMVPDPVKRIERWSMMVSGDDPQWHERFVSAGDSLGVYLNCAKTTMLAKSVAARYAVRADAVRGVADALATLVSDESKFRAMWEETPVVSNY